MEWADRGFVLSARKHGEHAVIASLLTQERGRHAGLVRGGAGRRARGIYQPGNLVDARWRARLEENLGTYSCELDYAYSARFLNEEIPLLAVLSTTAVLDRLLPEREPCPRLFEGFHELVRIMEEQEDWIRYLVRWELLLMTELGYGLDLTQCAVTGRTDDLVYVSPRSGRAVSREAGQPWHDRLFRLPSFLLGENAASVENESLEGLRLTGHFLTKCARESGVKRLPEIRDQFIDRLSRKPTICGGK